MDKKRRKKAARKMMKSPQIQERIRLEAYYTWELAGKPDGNDWWFWFEAEKSVYVEVYNEILFSGYIAKKDILAEESESVLKRQQEIEYQMFMAHLDNGMGDGNTA